MIDEITDKFLARLDLKRGNKDVKNDCSVLMPLLMMDNAYTLYGDYIAKSGVRHRLNHIRKEWERCYHVFNHQYFYPLTDDESDYVLDLMNEYEEYISHNLELTFLEVMTAFMDLDIDRRRVIGASVLINLLCQTANIMWNAVFERVYGRIGCKPINECERIIHEFANMYYGEKEPLVNLNQQKRLHDCVDALCRKQMQFVEIIIDRENGKQK